MWQAQMNTQPWHSGIKEPATFISASLWSGSRDGLPYKSARSWRAGEHWRARREHWRARSSLKPPKYTGLSLAFS